MAKKLYEEASVQAIANAIRAKNGSTATYKVAQMADAVLAIAPLQPDVEEYPQMSTTVAAYLTAAEAAYTDASGGGAGDTLAAEATTCVADQITASSFRLRTNGSSRCWANGSQIRWIALAM